MTTETDKIESDINRSRTALNDTLEQLGGKLSPGQMVDEVMGLAKGQAGEFLGTLSQQVRANPMPVLLIGAGIAMMVMNGRKAGARNGASSGVSDDEWKTEGRYRKLESARGGLSRMADETEDAFSHRRHEIESKAMELKQNAGEAIDAFKQRVSSTGHSLHETATGIRRRMGEGMDKAGDFAMQSAQGLKSGMGEAKHKAQAFYDDYPLAVGAIGLAVGAIIGASAPLTSLERNSLEGVADAANRAGADMAGKASDMASKAADKVASAVH